MHGVTLWACLWVYLSVCPEWPVFGLCRPVAHRFELLNLCSVLFNSGGEFPCCATRCRFYCCHVNLKDVLLTIVRRCLYGDALSYLVDLITPSAAASTRAGLRSAESMTVAVPRTLSSFGDRSFAPAGPRVSHRLMQSADTFRRHLKTFLFHLAFLS